MCTVPTNAGKRDGKIETGGEGIQFVSEHDEDNGDGQGRSGLRNDSSEERIMIKFILGLMIGTFIGFFTMGLCVVAADEDMDSDIRNSDK